MYVASVSSRGFSGHNITFYKNNKNNNLFRGESEIHNANSHISCSSQIAKINFTALDTTKTTTYFAREIAQQVNVIARILKERCNSGKIGHIDLDLGRPEKLRRSSGLKIVASGSSNHAGLMAQEFISKVAKIDVNTCNSGNFGHNGAYLNPNDLTIFVSQSGNTGDTYHALIRANKNGNHTIALANVPDSKIFKESSVGINVEAGEEKAVAATKSVTAQLINLYLIGLKLAEERGTLKPTEIEEHLDILKTIPNNLEEMLEDTECIERVAEKFKNSSIFYILSRGSNVGAAKEGALKLSETNSIPTVANDSGEFLHGHLAPLNETTPLIQIIASPAGTEEHGLAYSNIRKIITDKNPPTIIIKSEYDKAIEADPIFANTDFIDIPDIENFAPIYVAVRLQMLTEAITRKLGHNPDSPDKLVKAVIGE